MRLTAKNNWGNFVFYRERNASYTRPHEIWIVEWLVAQDNKWMMSAHPSREEARTKMGVLATMHPACMFITAKEWKG